MFEISFFISLKVHSDTWTLGPRYITGGYQENKDREIKKYRYERRENMLNTKMRNRPENHKRH